MVPSPQCHRLRHSALSDFAPKPCTFLDGSLCIEVSRTLGATDHVDAAPGRDQLVGEGALGNLAGTHDQGVEGDASLLDLRS